MKLYSLINNRRLKKLNIPKINNLNLYLLLGATILILGGFFYSQNTIAKSIDKNNKARLRLEKHTLNKNTKIRKNDTQSSSQEIISLSNLEENLSIKKISDKNKQIKIDRKLRKSVTDILRGTPMEQMIEPISQQDKIVAAFLVGIALKESGLGRHVPVLNGKNCFNYWGYRGKRARMGTGEHTCFDSPEDAVETVGKRIHTLAVNQKRDTPQKMLIWKCGSNCGATGGWPAAYKWARDVSIYFNKINNS